MTDSEYRSKLSPSSRGAFLFFGEEDYLRRHALATTRTTLLPVDDPFSHNIVKGVEGLNALADLISQPAMFSPVHLIELHSFSYANLSEESADLLLEAGKAAKEAGDVMLILVTDPSEFDAGILPKKPSAVYKKLTEVFTPVEFARVTGGKLSAWAGKHFAHEHIIAEPPELELIVERVGSSMSGLASEIDKLCAYIHAKGGERLTREDVEFVTCRSVETDAFGLSNSVLNCDISGAFTALADMRDRRLEPIVALSGVTKVFSDLLSVSTRMSCGQSQAEIASGIGMHPYKTGLYMDAAKRFGAKRIESASALCLEADAALKTGRQGYPTVERLLAAVLS